MDDKDNMLDCSDLTREQVERILAWHEADKQRAVREALKSRVATVTTIARDDPLQDAYDTWVDINGQRYGIKFAQLSKEERHE